jgi:hypothetical protein
MYFRKANLWSLAVLVFAAVFFTACSNSNDSDSHQHPGERPTYLVSFDTLGAQERAAVTVYEGDNLETIVYPPYKEGFEFLGWSSDPELFVSYELDTPVTSDLTLYAVWSGSLDTAPGKHRLTVHLQGGAFRNVPLQVLGIDFTEGQTLSRLPRVNGAPDHSTLVFASWNTKGDGRGRIIWNDTPLTEDIDIYAIYGTSVKSWDDMKAIECGNPDAVYVLQHDPKHHPNTQATCPILGYFTGFNTEWAPLCQDPNIPFKGQLYHNGTGGTICYTVRDVSSRAGFFAYADGAIVAGISLSTINMEGAEYMGALAAEMRNSRMERVYVSGLTFNDNRSNNEYSGGLVAWGDNLTFKDARISSTIPGVRGKNLGALAGYLSGSLIDNVTNSGSVRFIATADNARVGGLVGHMSGGRINGAYSPNYSYTVDGGSYNNVHAGGLVGFAENAELSNLNLYSPTARTTVSLSGDNSFGGVIAGSMANSNLRGALIYGQVRADFGNGTSVGGIAGEITGGSIKETLVFIDNVTAAGTGAKAGGIAGVAASAEIANNLFIGKNLPVSKAMASFITAPSVGPITGAAPSDLGTNNYLRSGILINNVPYAVSGSSFDFKALRGARGFFDTTLGWDFANNDIWEMLDYYDFPTLKAEHAEAFIPISTPEELLAISGPDVANASNTSPTLRQKYVLMSNLDLSGYSNWRPIGMVTNLSNGNDAAGDFSGVFLGNNKTISNLSGRSLFNRMSNGTIRSLNIVNAATNGSVLIQDTALGAASVIEDVHVSAGTVTTSGINVAIATGGLVSSIQGSSVIESSFEGSITGDSSNSVGGIAGGLTSGSYIYKNYSSGTISASRTGTGSATIVVGGIIGTSSGTNIIEDSYSTALISSSAQTPATYAANAYAGGIAGTISGKIINSHYAGSGVYAAADNTGTAMAANINAYAGGIAGNVAANTEISSSLSLTRNIEASVSGTSADPLNARYGRIGGYRANTATSLINGSYGLLLSTYGATSQDPVNQGGDVPGDAISLSFFGTYMPDWDLAGAWYMYDGASYPTFR